MSYGASAGRGDRLLPLLCVSSCGTLSWKRLKCPDAFRVAVVACTSAIRALLAFGFGYDPAHNFLLKRVCCRFAQAIGVTSDPELLSPIYSRSVPARSGCVRRPLVPGRRRHHPLEAPGNLVARGCLRPHQRRRPDQTLVEPAAP